MAIAKHLSKREIMSYDARCYPPSSKKNHLTFNALRNHPKFSEDGTKTGFHPSQLDESPPIDHDSPNIEPSSAQSLSVPSNSDTSSESQGFIRIDDENNVFVPMKALAQEDWETEEDVAERAGFSPMLWKQYFRRILQRLSTAQERGAPRNRISIDQQAPGRNDQCLKPRVMFHIFTRTVKQVMFNDSKTIY